MRILSANDVHQAAPMAAAIDAVAAAFARLSNSQATVPLRTRIDTPAHDATSLFMPAYLAGQEEATTPALGVKVVSIFPHNVSRYQLPSIHALVVLINPETGQPIAVLDGTYLTALRTGAASGAATRLMARPDARVLALFGAGAQARTQALAVCTVRSIERILIVNRTEQHADQLRALLSADGIQADVCIAPSSAIALAEADVVCCATSTPKPLFDDANVRPGTHINGVGSYTPHMAEVPANTVARARLVVDQRAAAWEEAGDLIQARSAGLIDEHHVVAELGEVVAGNVPARTNAQEITFFKSVGNAVQDLAVGQLALKQALAHDIGREIPL
ncbi:MAG: ornithine cyclodeaminase [Chloroflexales bacterium]|nr:ornithine cyclodeaminase [Chloroflexales bacterium]